MTDKRRKRGLIVCISPLAVTFIAAGVFILAMVVAALIAAALGSGE